MVFNWFEWERDGKDVPKIHPAQKSVKVLKKLIETFTDEGDVVIDPCCGSGTTLRAAHELGRSAFGFEIDRNFYTRAKNEMLVFDKPDIEVKEKKIVTSTKTIIEEVSEHNLNQIKGQMSLFD
jgi:site-specific DNA-methyltransferase (adenine-specific)